MNKIIVLFAFLLSFGIQAQFNVEHSVYFDTDVYNLTKTEKTRLQKYLSSLTKDEVQKIESNRVTTLKKEYNSDLIFSSILDPKKLFQQKKIPCTATALSRSNY